MDEEREQEPVEPATEGDPEWRERTQETQRNADDLGGAPPPPSGDDDGPRYLP